MKTKLLIASLASFIAGLLLMYQFTSRQHKAVGITTIDTVEIVRYVPKIVKKDSIVKVPVPYKVTVLDSPIYVVDKKNYSDTVELDSGLSVHYDALVVGYLETLHLGYIDTRPTKIIERTVTKTLTLPSKPSRGLYVGGEASLSLDRAAVGIQFHNKLNIYGYNYTLTPTNSNIARHSISYYRRIF